MRKPMHEITHQLDRSPMCDPDAPFWLASVPARSRASSAARGQRAVRRRRHARGILTVSINAAARSLISGRRPRLAVRLAELGWLVT